MNWFEKICYALTASMEEPHTFGWFHLLSVGLCILATVLLCVFAKDANKKTFRRIVLIAWILMVIAEVYKEVVYMSFKFDGTSVTWDYDWYAFPYQLCSTPLYLLPFVAFLKDGKVKNAIMAFLSTFAMFGGLVTFIYPEQVFVSMIGVNIQTMLHHGLQIVLGVYFAVYNRKKLNIKYFLSGIIVFAVMLVIAMGLNLIVPKFVVGETFNMFFISPLFECTLPVLSMIYPLVPYPVFLIAYILGFILAAFIMYIIPYGFIKLAAKNKKHEKSN